MTSDAMPLLRQFLQQQVDHGRTHIALTGEARAILPSVLAGRTRAAAEVAAKAAQQPTPAVSSEAAAPKASVPAAVPPIDVPGGTREEKLARLAQMAEDFAAARALGTLRHTMVFAVGNPHAEVMFVGEAPGAEEERQREPFVGPAGQLLTKIITAMGLKRGAVYISNICKFRPAIENQTTGNRKPTPAEMKTCLPFVMTEIDIIRPKVIIALGATAAEGLGIEGSVSKNRGRPHSVAGIPVVVTYHPSFLLRQEQEGRGIEAKRQSWEDMLLAMETAGLPITDKQRGFFRRAQG